VRWRVNRAPDGRPDANDECPFSKAIFVRICSLPGFTFAVESAKVAAREIPDP
jgi:hypothetical protein